ncbi:hypothetical protein J6590_089985 [Homalodisca vitripennis]|nr:hypothetical protein J6590_089985 [Homalodisca vitripennis]
MGTMLTAEPRVEAMRGSLYPQRRTMGTMLTAEPRVEAMRGRLYPQRRTMGGDRSLGTMLTAEPRVEPSYEKKLVSPASHYGWGQE